MNTISKNKNRTVVLASGVFDLVHYGHVYFLQEAKKAGGETSYLVVVIARDKTVEKLKGKLPVLPEEQRRAIVAALKPVDETILGQEEFDMTKILREIKPNIVAVGYDQKGIEDEAKSIIAKNRLDAKVVRFRKFLESELDSSSKIRNKILGQH